jgi:hypothetical protein
MIRTEHTMPVDVGESQPAVIVVSLISHLWRPRSCSTTAFMSVSCTTRRESSDICWCPVDPAH